MIVKLSPSRDIYKEVKMFYFFDQTKKGPNMYPSVLSLNIFMIQFDSITD